MRRKLNRFTKYIVAFGIISATTAVGNIVPISANGNIESEFSSVIEKYKSKDIIVEDGVSLRKGEKLDLSDNPNWEMSDNNTVNIENGVVTPKNSGTVFLSQEIDDKVKIKEVYVPRQIRSYSFAVKPKEKRNYYKVFVDPGHGGKDNGASGNGNNEDQLNLQVAKRVEKKLIDKGIEVKMSRSSDEFISLEDRSKMANQYSPDVFISIHQNSADNSSANGIETYYHTKKGEYEPYAKEIQSHAIDETGARDRKVKNANFAVLRETNMPAALFESGFITNPSESAKLASPEYQDKLATGIVNGIETYLKQNIQLNGDSENSDRLEIINTGTVTATSLNVRSGYGTGYDVIGILSKGDKVEIVESKNGWYKIKYKNTYGYISGSYIKLDTIVKPPSMELGWNQKNDEWYYYKSDGTMAIGWEQVGGTWYYFNNSGVMKTDWLQLEDTWYYLKPNGAMAVGWEQVGGTWYYFNNSGAMKTDWLQLGDTWYYLKPNGAMAVGWEQVGGTWYYFNNSGAMKTGWLQLGDTWYYLKSNGAMAVGWEQVGGTWYYFNNSGAMKTGWLQLGDTWYYLKSNGAMAVGWELIGNDWYYFDIYGGMVTNETIDGWKIGSNGIASLA